MKGVQCYELFGGIALKNHTFSFFHFHIQNTNKHCCVSQGSTLGTKLFIIYINDICNITLTLKFGLFADNTNICSSGYDITDICVKVNS